MVTASGHGSDLVRALEVLINHGLVEELDPGKHVGALDPLLLLRGKQVIQLATGEGDALGMLVLG